MKTTIRLAAKKCCAIVLCMLCNLTCYAQVRSLEEVADSAIAFFANMSNTPASSKNASQSQIRSAVDIRPITRGNTTYLYSVNLPNGGWALVSNERQYKTIIGYGFNGPFDTDPAAMPPALNDLLNHHMNMIDSLRQDGADRFYSRRATFSPHITRSSTYTLGDSLLIKNGIYLNWDQSYNNWNCFTDTPSDPCCERVYNKFCPTNVNQGCGHAAAGCGAVAMGQLMNYWSWPDYALIPDTITNQFFCFCGVPSESAHVHFYDWEHMPANIIYNTDLYDVDNIAKLLRDCGYAAQTYYTNGGSAAMMEKIDVAMRETFHYHATFVVERPWVDVASIIKTDIDALRPVMSQAWHDGDDVTPHTFLIDGYKNDNMFHINFGWGGYLDNWYDLGFNGYTGFRNFLTEIYPNCNYLPSMINYTGITIHSNENMSLYSYGTIYVGGDNQNFVVENDGHFTAQAGDSIVLRSGFHAKSGSYVHISTRDFCNYPGSHRLQAPNKDTKITGINQEVAYNMPLIHNTTFSITPNPVNTILHIQSSGELSQAKIYNLNGQCVLQSAATDIDVSALPQGMYILRAEMSDGGTHQAKFIKE